MFFVLIVSLYTSRVVLQMLGVVDFGVYSVVAGFVSMFGFLNSTLTASMQRYYNFEGVRDEHGLQKVYSAGLFIHIILAAVILLLMETAGRWYLNSVMVIPQDRMYAAGLVFQASALSMLSMLLQIPYSGAIISAEKMDYYAVVSITDVVLKLAAVFILPYIPLDKLVLYSVALAIISIFDFFAYFIYSKVRILKFKATRDFDSDLFKSIISFSGWNLFGTFVFMLKGQGVNMVLNYFFGPMINAARGVANQVSAAVSGFSVNIMTAFQPQVVESYSRGDFDRTRNLMFIESRIAFFLILTVISPVIVNVDFLLNIWLGDVIPDSSGLFSTLILIDVLVCTLNTPCTQVISATGKLKLYQICTSSVNILLVPICCLLLYLGFDASSVFVATIAISIVNQCVSIAVVQKQFAVGIQSYLKVVILPCLSALLIIGGSQYCCCFFLDDYLVRFIVSVVADVVLAVPVFYWVVATTNEKAYVSQFLKSHSLCRK